MFTASSVNSIPSPVGRALARLPLARTVWPSVGIAGHPRRRLGIAPVGPCHADRGPQRCRGEGTFRVHFSRRAGQALDDDRRNVASAAGTSPAGRSRPGRPEQGGPDHWRSRGNVVGNRRDREASARYMERRRSGARRSRIVLRSREWPRVESRVQSGTAPVPPRLRQVGTGLRVRVSDRRLVLDEALQIARYTAGKGVARRRARAGRLDGLVDGVRRIAHRLPRATRLVGRSGGRGNVGFVCRVSCDAHRPEPNGLVRKAIHLAGNDGGQCRGSRAGAGRVRIRRSASGPRTPGDSVASNATRLLRQAVAAANGLGTSRRHLAARRTVERRGGTGRALCGATRAGLAR